MSVNFLWKRGKEKQLNEIRKRNVNKRFRLGLGVAHTYLKRFKANHPVCNLKLVYGLQFTNTLRNSLSTGVFFLLIILHHILVPCLFDSKPPLLPATCKHEKITTQRENMSVAFPRTLGTVGTRFAIGPKGRLAIEI